MVVVYIIRSVASGLYYVGHTEDLERRLEEHNSGRSHFTKKRGPWELVYQEEIGSRGEAMRRERAIKARRSRLYIERLVAEYRARQD
jgi:putative endonuclease